MNPEEKNTTVENIKQLKDFETLIEKRNDLGTIIYNYNTHVSANIISTNPMLGENTFARAPTLNRYLAEIVTTFADYFFKHFNSTTDSYSNQLLEQVAHQFYLEKSLDDPVRYPPMHKDASVQAIMRCEQEYQLAFAPQHSPFTYLSIEADQLRSAEREQTIVRAIISEHDALDKFDTFITNNQEYLADKTIQEIFQIFSISRNYLYQEAQEKQPEQERNALRVLANSI
jgi:hypothetical protein